MSLTTLIAAKDLGQTYTPILLAEITFADGTVLRLSTHDFRTATTGLQYNSHDYLPLILNQSIAGKAVNSEGIDAVPSVSLDLADADRTLWNNFELTKGFKGATMILRFVFVDLLANTFSSDSKLIFNGICDPPSITVDTLTLPAVSKVNMTNINLPGIRIQRTHPFPFPSTVAERTAALNDPSSPFWYTGYSPDIPDTGNGHGFGNLNGGVPYTADDFDFTYTGYLKVMGSGGGTGATATATLFDDLPRHGNVQSITVTNGGSGYTSTPFVVVKGNGTAATAHANVSGGVITSIDVDHEGDNYTSVSVLINPATGDLTKDSSGRATGTFGGIRWIPPNTFSGRSYTTGNTITNGANFDTTQSLYGDFIPIIYGTGMVQPVIVSVLGDPNSTRGEIILCQGQINGLYNNQIVVNDVNVPGQGHDGLITWNYVNPGGRHGAVNLGAIFDGKGDCYGNFATLTYTVYNQIAQSNSAPNIRAVVIGPSIPVFTGTGVTDYTFQYSDNPAWVLLDMLVKGPWTYADIDLQSFIDAAAICSRSISFMNNDGTSGNHPLFQASLVLRQRQSASEYVRQFRTSFRAMLIPNANGLLKVFIKQTLADQQPGTITGSNYNTAVSSVNHAGTTTNGFVAYKFTDTNGTILRRNGKSTLSISQQPITNAPNQLSFSFQDQYNGYQSDTISTSDSLDVARSAQLISKALPVVGISSFDQGQRIAAVTLAETLRGNTRGDTGGTLTFAWETSFKALHLELGQIVMLTSAHDNLSNILVRITKITPAMNFETVKLEGTFHIDEWYEDAFGQDGFVSHVSAARASQNRPPFPWLPNELQPTNSSDPLIPRDTLTFDVAQDYTEDAAGNTIANLVIIGKAPINTFSSTVQAPLVRPAFTTSSTGGNLHGSTNYCLCLCGVDPNGGFSIPSVTINVPIAAGTNTNTVTLTDITWDPNTNGYALFAGNDPNTMCWQAQVNTTPSSITLSTLLGRTWGVPDLDFDKLQARIKRVRHSGVIGTNISSVTSSTITFLTAGWTTNQWAGRTVTFLGDADNFNALPVWNYHVVSNTSDTLTVTGNPMTDGIDGGDVMTIRTLADTFSANTIGDSQYINSFSTGGLDADAEIGNMIRIVAGTGAGQPVRTIQSNTSTVLTIDGTWTVTPDATSIFIVEEPNWLENYQTDSINNSDPDSDLEIDLRIDNFLDTTLLVELSTVDGAGQESLSTKNVFREVYVFGADDASLTTITALGWQASLNALPQDSY